MRNRKEDDSLRRRLVQLTHLYFRETFQALKDTGIHPKQVPFMILLDEQEGMSQREISQELGISPPTVAVSVKRLEKSGLVERREDEQDLRRSRIFLTERGKETIQDIKTCVEEKEALVLSGYDHCPFVCPGFLRFVFARLYIKNHQRGYPAEGYRGWCCRIHPGRDHESSADFSGQRG